MAVIRSSKTSELLRGAAHQALQETLEAHWKKLNEAKETSLMNATTTTYRRYGGLANNPIFSQGALDRMSTSMLATGKVSLIASLPMPAGTFITSGATAVGNDWGIASEAPVTLPTLADSVVKMVSGSWTEGAQIVTKQPKKFTLAYIRRELERVARLPNTEIHAW